MILPRGIVVPFSLLVALTTTTIVFAAGVGEAPAKFVGGADVLLLGPDDALPGRAAISSNLAKPMADLPVVEAVSPEVYVLTAMDGRSTFVRGVDFPAFFRIEGLDLSDGRMPVRPEEALAGEVFARAHGVRVGDEVFVTSSFLRFGTPVTVVGIVDTQGPVRDELLVSLDVAQPLAELDTDQVHVIRALTSNMLNLSRIVNSFVPEFTYSDVEISGASFIAGEPVVVRANLTNWGRVEGTKPVRIFNDGRLIAQENYTVPARTTVPIEVEFFLFDPGIRDISINPTFRVEVEEPAYRFVEHPGGVARDVPFTTRLVDANNTPISGATVREGERVLVTDELGRITVAPTGTEPTIRLYAYEGDRIIATLHLPVADPPAEGPARLELAAFRVVEPGIGNMSVFHVLASVRNRGGEAGVAQLRLLVDGEPAAQMDVGVSGGAISPATFELGPLPPGRHKLTLEPFGADLDIRVFAGPDPSVEAYLEAEDRGRGEDASDLPTHGPDYVTEVIGNVRGVIAALCIFSALLTSFGVVFVLVRHLAEAQPRIGIYRAIGATNARMTSLVEREAASRMAVAALVGIGIGVLAARLIAASALVRAFGHSIDIAYPWRIMVIVFLLATGVAVVSARAIVAYHLRTPVDHLMRGSSLRPLPVAPPTLESLIEGPR